MPSICLYLKTHQPYRVKRYRVFDVGEDSNYFNDNSETSLNNEKVLHKIIGKSYLPTNKLLLDLLQKHPEFKVSFSLSGVLLEQLEATSPETIESFKRLVATGRVEVLGENYYHSLAFFHSLPEFEEQVRMHRDKIKKLFGMTPTVFTNTEMSYTNSLALWAEQNGYKGITAEGWDGILGWRSPNFLYEAKDCSKIKVLLKNYRLSDDIAFRFGDRGWKEWPLSVPKYVEWINAINGNGETVNLFMDYETFGEHQWEDTGIFEFLRYLPGELLKNKSNNFVTPTEATEKYKAVGEFDVPHILTWADTERDLSAWTGNDMQTSALDTIYSFENKVRASGDAKLIDDWRKLQTSDHFYYMCTKWFSDGDVHAYFSPYKSPYDAFISYMNVITDMRLRLEKSMKVAQK
jgi:alpha-amylase